MKNDSEFGAFLISWMIFGLLIALWEVLKWCYRGVRRWVAKKSKGQ